MGLEFEPVNFHKIQWSPQDAVDKSYYFYFMIGQVMIIFQKCKKSVFLGVSDCQYILYFGKVGWFYIRFPQVAQQFRKKMHKYYFFHFLKPNLIKLLSYGWSQPRLLFFPPPPPHPLNFFFGKQIRKSYCKGSKNTTTRSSKPRDITQLPRGQKGQKEHPFSSIFSCSIQVMNILRYI